MKILFETFLAFYNACEIEGTVSFREKKIAGVQDVAGATNKLPGTIQIHAIPLKLIFFSFCHL
jgi:hypothetical protein